MIPLLLAFGCTPGADSGAAPGAELLRPDAWRLAAPAEDPWADQAPADTACPSTAFGPEGAFFEVETDPCPWGTWAQALAAPVDEGQTLAFTFFHLDLWAPDPAESVVALHLGGVPVWELRQPVPSEAAVHEVEVTAPRRFAAGTTATFHVHNHGANSYRLGQVLSGAGGLR